MKKKLTIAKLVLFAAALALTTTPEIQPLWWLVGY